MTENGPVAEKGATLWYRARAPWRAAVGVPEAPDDLTLAAYLDGTLDEAAAEAVDVWMAAVPEGLDSVVAARAGLADAPEASPGAVRARVIARAQAIVHPGQTQGAAPRRWGGMFGGLMEHLRPMVWAGAAAAVLLASVSGFELGRVGVEHMTSMDAAVAQDVRMVMGQAGQDLL